MYETYDEGAASRPNGRSRVAQGNLQDATRRSRWVQLKRDVLAPVSVTSEERVIVEQITVRRLGKVREERASWSCRGDHITATKLNLQKGKPQMSHLKTVTNHV